MVIYIASDHAGYELKKVVSDLLVLKGLKMVDLGPDQNESVDYPDFAKKLCKKVVEDETNKGILICGTGLGMSMTANRFRNIRAALCMNTTMAHYSRVHNNANVLCMGARIIGTEVAKDIVDKFLNTGFEWGRHKKRIDKIEINDDESFQCSANLDDLDVSDDDNTKQEMLNYANELNTIKADYELLLKKLEDNQKGDE